MKILPASSAAVWIIGLGLTIVTWLVVLTAKVPNPPPRSSKPAAQTATSPAAAPAGSQSPVTYVQMNYDQPAPAPAP